MYDIDPMTLILKFDPDNIMMYYYAKSEVSTSIHSNRHTHTHMKTLQNITSTGYAGGNEVDFSGGARICYRGHQPCGGSDAPMFRKFYVAGFPASV